MTTSIFVETETPSALFLSSGGSRGGFGEMTVYKQRFSRWNFFFSSGIYWNLEYLLLDWRLGWWEVGAKVFVFQEVSTVRGINECIEANLEQNNGREGREGRGMEEGLSLIHI